MEGTGRRGREGGWKDTWGPRSRGQWVATPLPSGSPNSSLVPGAPGNSARLLGLQPTPIVPLCSDMAPLPQAWLSLAAVGGCQCLYPPSPGGSPELREPAQRCQGGVPGEPACAPRAWAAGEERRLSPAPSISPLYQHEDLGLGVCLLPHEPEQLLWVDNNSSRNPS